MQDLEYPFDSDFILTKKKKLKRLLLEQANDFVSKKIAVLGGSTTHDIIEILDLFLLNYGIKAVFYESAYNQFYQEAVFANHRLAEFAPDIIYVCTSNRNIQDYPSLENSEDEVGQMLEKEKGRYEMIWKTLSSRYQCPIIQNNFEMPVYRLLGNKDASDIHGRVNYVTRLNMEFYRYAQEHDNFYICDINYISADYGLKEWSDPFYYYMYKYALNVSAVPYLSFNVANIIKSVFGKNKKGFVMDLDQTLWGGVIGEDGAEHIILGPEDSKGQAYQEFQKYIKEHLTLGVLLAIDSKNNLENALSGLNHPDSILKPKDFIEIEANWEPKDKNFSRIAAEARLLPESLVFIDDNPTERYIVTKQIPGVSAPDLGEIHQYIQRLDRSGFFEVTTLSDDDTKRNTMYRENMQRFKAQQEFTDYREFLKSLNMKAVIRNFEAFYAARIAQLSNKSNQFNLTTRRYTQAEIEKLVGDSEYITLYGRLSDRFGDNGVVSVIIGRVCDDECQIKLWVMSCRVLKRDMECAMMDALIQKCIDKGLNKVRGYYYPTARNSIVREFYAYMGFDRISEDEKGNTEWLYQIYTDYERKNKVIQVEEQECEERRDL